MSDITEVKWKRKEALNWINNNTTEKDLIQDKYTIVFQPHYDFEDIPEKEIDILPNQLNVLEVSTKRKAEVGSVKINIFPKVASTIGVKWRIKGTDTWYLSEEVQSNVPIGLKEIEFQLNEYTRINEPLKLNILRDHTTEINYILILTGEQLNTLEELFIEDIKNTNCNKRIPLENYRVIFSGASGIIVPDELTVKYFESVTVSFIAGYKFKLGGIINDITVTGNKIVNLTETSLTTGIVYNDSFYSFNVQWIHKIDEEILITSDNQFSFSKTKGKPKQLEDVGILSNKEYSLQIRKAYKEFTFEESIGEKLISSSFQKRVLKLSELPYNHVHLGCDKFIELSIRNQIKHRSFSDDFGLISDNILNVTIRDTINTGNIKKTNVLIGADVITTVQKRRWYVGYILQEDLFITSSTSFMDLDTQNPNITKNKLTDPTIIESVNFTEINKHNTKFLTPSSLTEEVGLISDSFFSMDKQEKENKFLLPIEEVGIRMNTVESVDITVKIKPKSAPIEELGIKDTYQFNLDIINKENKINVPLTEIGISSSSINDLTKKTTNAIVETIDIEEIVPGAMTSVKLEIHDGRMVLQSEIEDPLIVNSITDISVNKTDPRFERNVNKEDVSILSSSILDMEKKTSTKKNTITEEPYLLADTILSVHKYRKLEKVYLNEPIGINSPTLFGVDIISHLVKSKLTDDSFISSTNFFSVTIKSHLIKEDLNEQIGIKSNTVNQVDISVKSITHSSLEEIGINSLSSYSVDIKSHLIKQLVQIEEISPGSDILFNVDLTKKCKSSTVPDAIGIISNNTFVVDIKTKIYSSSFNEVLGITSNSSIVMDKEVKNKTSEQKEEVSIKSSEVTLVEKKVP